MINRRLKRARLRLIIIIVHYGKGLPNESLYALKLAIKVGVTEFCGIPIQINV